MGEAAPASDLAGAGRELARLAGRSLEVALSPPAEERARRLRDHVEGYVLPRAADVDTPLLVLLLGPTGAGKSSILNTIAGARISETGALRPTTRKAVLYATEADARHLLEGGRFARVPPGRLARVGAPPTALGVAVVDAPDIDSVERENRLVADVFLEACDLCVFVTTATRYADLVPYEVLQRVRDRGLPLIVVLNRLPPSSNDRELVVADATRLLVQAGLASDGMSVIPVQEGERDRAREALAPETLRPLLGRIHRLTEDREERRRAAAEALAGSLRGLAPLAHAVADDVEHAAIDAESLRRIAASAYGRELDALRRTLREGTFFREEVIRQWHDFVGADQVTRFFASGLAKARALLLGALRARPEAPVGPVQQEAISALEALALRHAGEAARRTASGWSERSDAARLLEDRGGLWSVSDDLGGSLREELKGWMRTIADDVRAAGQRKRELAQVAALGVNVVAVAVMLGVFSHTAGLTGTEFGIAGGTAFLNQKLLEAIFGERAMEELVTRARHRLDALLAAVFERERLRFDALVPPPGDLRALAANLRAAVARIAA
jgi:energy-coupling factor transporter ATP-binding protein EcfA2